MSKHKHRKGFREDQVMMSEAYGSIYNESDFAAGLENPSYGRDNYILQAIRDGRIKVVEVEGLDPREHEQADAYIVKAFIQTRDGERELTDDEYDYINNPEYPSSQEPGARDKMKTYNDLVEFVSRAAEEEVINYRAGQEDAEDDEVGLTVKDPARAFKELEDTPL